MTNPQLITVEAPGERERRQDWAAAEAGYLAAVRGLARFGPVVWDAYAGAHDRLIETPAPDAAGVMFKLASVSGWLDATGAVDPQLLDRLDRDAPRSYEAKAVGYALAEAIELGLLSLGK